MDKYFLDDDCSRKEIKLLELKQHNMIMADYATKFEELSRFYPHYNGMETKGSKCVKFKSGVRPKIKQFISYQEIRHFSVLVKKCKIYDEDIRARSAHYKSASEKESGNQNYGKPYMDSVDKGKLKSQQKAVGGKETNGGEITSPLRCFRCGELCHRAA